MIVDSAYLHTTGRWLPPRQSARRAVADGTADRGTLLAADLVSLTGDADITAAEMAGRAALEALGRSRYTPADIGNLLHATFTPEESHFAPWSHVQHILGADRAQTMQVCAGSNGGMAALLTTTALLPGLPEPGVGMVTAAAHFPTGTWPRWQPSGGMFAADGAAAAVLSREPGPLRVIATTHASEPGLEELTRAVEPHKATVHQSHMMLQESGLSDYTDVLRTATERSVRQLLDEAGLTMSDIDHAIVPGIGRQFVEAVVTKPLGIDINQSWFLLRQTGHIGPCDQLVALDHLMRHRRPHSGQHILVISFGIGFTWSNAVLRVT